MFLSLTLKYFRMERGTENCFWYKHFFEAEEESQIDMAHDTLV